MIAFTVGELIEFAGLPVAGAAGALWLAGDMETGHRSLLLYAVATLGGLGEGAVLAWFQARVLKDFLPQLSAVRWILYTALAASFAWACGMLAPTLDDLVGLSALSQAIIWAPAAC